MPQTTTKLPLIFQSSRLDRLDRPVFSEASGCVCWLAGLAESTLLNIEAKLRSTALKQGKAVDFIRGIQNLESCERDRIKADVTPEMPSAVRGLETFTELNPDLNEMNHKGFPISFKEKVAFCSLQLSYAEEPKNGLLSSDIDIDLLTDIGHFGEVIEN